MYKKLLVAAGLCSLLAGCFKSNEFERQPCVVTPVTAIAPEDQRLALKNYLDSKGIVATEDRRGFFFDIITPGAGQEADNCSAIWVDYKGWLTNDEVFTNVVDDEQFLGNLILGWQAGIPLIKPGGKITLYLPPSFGYGTTGSGQIPPNAITIFEISLKGVAK